MSTVLTQAPITDRIEQKLELIAGQLVVGNSVVGSRYLLHDLLRTWGAAAAIPFAEPELWWRALAEAFSEIHPPSPTAGVAAWRAWAAGIEFDCLVQRPSVAAIPDEWKAKYWRAFGFRELRQVARMFERPLMRLGNEVFMPDLILNGPSLDRTLDRYHHGPADVVIEVMAEGHRDQDRSIRRQAYAEARVAEYWIVDPQGQHVEFWILENGRYQRERVGLDCRYRSIAIPGLAVLVHKLWPGCFFGSNVFELRPHELDGELAIGGGGLGWGDLPFEPAPALDPQDLNSEQFISWCPRAEFTMLREKPLIESVRGTRHVLGMLLRNFGLIEAVPSLHPREWVEAVANARRTRRSKPKAVRDEVERTARRLHREFPNIGTLVAVGNLTGGWPHDLWTDVTLVIRDTDHRSDLPYQVDLPFIYHELVSRKSKTYVADIQTNAELFPDQQRQLAENGIEL